MPAKATNLNRHGAAIQLPRQLLVGSTVMVRNARGTQVSARVVAQLAVSEGLSIYGIEFLQQDDTTNSFWGITFPALEGRTSGAQAADQIGIARRRGHAVPAKPTLLISARFLFEYSFLLCRETSSAHPLCRSPEVVRREAGHSRRRAVIGWMLNARRAGM
jgi:hypothetical protein